MNDASPAPSKDSRVRDAIAHWAPRFVANGISLTDFQEVTADVARWEDWCRAWSARAAVHEEMGRAAFVIRARAGGQDAQLAIDLHGVGVDHGAAEAFGEHERDLGLAAGRRPCNQYRGLLRHGRPFIRRVFLPHYLTGFISGLIS